MSQTIRLSVQLWDHKRRVRMSEIRDVAVHELQAEADEIIGAMLPAFTRRPKHRDQARTASAGAGSGSLLPLRRRKGGRR